MLESLNNICRQKFQAGYYFEKLLWEAQKAILKLSGVSVPDSEPEREMDYDDEADEYDDDESVSSNHGRKAPIDTLTDAIFQSNKNRKGKKFSGSDTDPERQDAGWTRSPKWHIGGRFSTHYRLICQNAASLL